MTNAALEITNTIAQINGLDVVKSVNDFYASAFNQLLILMSILGALVGIVVPFLISFYQGRQLKFRESELKLEVGRLVEGAKNELLQQITEKLQSEKELISEALAKNVATIEKRLAKVEAYAFHLQGNESLNKERFCQACGDYCKAGVLYCKAGQGSDLITTLKLLSDKVLPQVSKRDLEKNGMDERLDLLVGEVEKFDHKGLLNDPIRNLRQSIKDAKARQDGVKAN